MRIGTWNLAGRWSSRHQRLVEDAACDVWLLTEVPAAFSLTGGQLVRSESMPVAAAPSWAAVWSNGPLTLVDAPHPAAAMARREDLLICSCVLPWRGARPHWPDGGPTTAAITIAALGRLRPALTAAEHAVVWGGDWNHALRGGEYAGSTEGRVAIEALVAGAGLAVTTVDAPHAIDGLLSIDYIAIPATWRATPCRRVVASIDGARLSDHDAYVVEAVGP